MSGLPLFVEPNHNSGILKTGMEARLSDKAEEWPQEILQEALKQHPYLGQYSVSPVMRSVEDERGYALGFLLVRNKTTRLNTPAGKALAAEAGVRSIRIPALVEEQKLKDLDVFTDTRGKPLPLNEERVRQALFRPDLFDSYGEPPENATMIGDQMVPPDRSDRMTGSRGGVDKSAAERPLLMEAIAPTILSSDLERVTSALNDDPLLARTLIQKEASRPVMKILGELEPITSVDVARTVIDNIEPDTVQLHRFDDEYFLKTASSYMYMPQIFQADRIKMAEVVGEDMVATADQHGVATLSTDPVVKEDLSTDLKVEPVERFGEYKVRDAQDREILGWVFPSVLDFSNNQLPVKVFTNGTAHAIQSDIAGSLVGKGTNMISSDKLEGDGFFFMLTEDGSALAFMPGSIAAAFEDPKGPGIRFESSFSGAKYTLRLTPGIKKAMPLGDDDGEFAIPANVKWCPMKGEAVKLVEDPTLFAKTAASLNPSNMMTILSDGQVWSFAGDPVEKLAAEDRQFLEAPEALFLACCAGVDAPLAMRKLAQAGQQKVAVQVHGCRHVEPPSVMLQEVEGMAKAAVAGMPPKYDLLKEAAGLNDVNTIDKVLSLGFLTPENLSTFIEYLPDFDEVVQKLAYLLLATRMGLPDPPEQTVKSAMERLEEVCRALKELVYRKQ